MKLTNQPIPENTPKWKRDEIKRLRADMRNPAKRTSRKGVLRWKSNNAVIPPHVFKDALVECPETQRAAYEKDTAAFLSEYRRNRRNRRPSAEEMFEMQANFPAGTKVVDMVTGRHVWTVR